MDKTKLFKYLFLVGILICLVPIWMNTYFVTGDGPSHLYNSTVLLDYFKGSTAFYSEFYTLNTELEPNWLSHFLYSILLTFLPAFLAEKVLLSAYIILFFFGLKKLILKINPEAVWLTVVAIPFVYQKVFLMGFFNCAFGFVVFFFTLNYWLKHKDSFRWLNAIILCLLLILNYFSHPVALALSLVSIGISYLIQTFFVIKNGEQIKESLLKGVFLLLATLPALTLIYQYVQRSTQASLPLNVSGKKLFHSLIESDYLYNLNRTEHIPAMLFSIGIGLVILHSLVLRFVRKDFTPKHGFGILFFLLILLYFNVPDYMAGGAFFVERLQFTIFLIGVLWAANTSFGNWWRQGYLLGIFCLGSVIVISRYTTHYEMSKAAVEITSAAEYIEDNSTLLCLSYCHNGRTTDGELINDKFWSFMHIGDYIGTEKKIVSLTNYEANTGYFPILYHEEINPFYHLGPFESQPPAPQIKNYENVTGKTVDYVLLCFYMEEDSISFDNENTFRELSENYKLTYTSEHQRAILYERLDK